MSQSIEFTRVLVVRKATEGGPGLSAARCALKRAGIRHEQRPSGYVGHTELWIQTGTLTRARRALRPYGYEV